MAIDDRVMNEGGVMFKWTAVMAVALLAGSVAGMEAQTPQQRSNGSKKATLTAMDYIDIQQLLARYSFPLDTGADHGYMYADLYLPDGVFNTSKGREALAALARGGRLGQTNVRNLGSFPII